MPRYLYGDSSPTNLDFDFLSALESFIQHAAPAVRMQRELDRMVEVSQVDAQARQHGLGKLERFHRELMKIIEEATAQTQEVEVMQYGQQVSEQAVAIVERHRAQARQAVEGTVAQIDAERRRRAKEIQREVAAFAVHVRLPDMDWKAKMRLEGNACQMTALVTHPAEITCGYALDAARLPFWQAPRQVSDFVKDLDLQVGVKKGLFSRGNQPEIVHLDDHYVSAFVVDDKAAEFRLRKKLDAEETYALSISRNEDGHLSGVVRRPGVEGPEAQLQLTEHADRDRVDRLRIAVRKFVADALPYKQAVLSVELGKKDVFSSGLVIPLVERVVEHLAPTLAEVRKHSPNAAELSIKREDDSGRREEVYCSRQVLVDHIRQLDNVGMQVFAKLGLLTAADLTEEGRSVDVPMDD